MTQWSRYAALSDGGRSQKPTHLIREVKEGHWEMVALFSFNDWVEWQDIVEQLNASYELADNLAGLPGDPSGSAIHPSNFIGMHIVRPEAGQEALEE